jgi:hypothetical protein
VLRLELFTIGHESILRLRQTFIVGIAAAGGNVFRWTCVESSTV